MNEKVFPEKIMIYLTKQQKKKLEQTAKKDNRKQSQIVRLALEQYIPGFGGPL